MSVLYVWCTPLRFKTSGYTNANILYYGLPDTDIQKMQRIQNKSAKLDLKQKNFESPTECLIKLHWLPIRTRIEYKVEVYTLKMLA